MGDYRHAAKRKNNPPAKIAAEGTVPAIPRAQYAYNAHLPPVLRFDQSGGPDTLPKLLAEAGRRTLTPDEQRLLADALRRQDPWLEWTGKREAKSFEVDPVALHIHERISTQAILKVAARQDVQRSLFADPQQEYPEAVQFYRHDVDWANRLILGDSLAVMSSLARREDLAGKVQMIYLDPPYGIKFASNFQPEVGRRDVKDKEQDLTREPEMVRAYRDTLHLGIQSQPRCANRRSTRSIRQHPRSKTPAGCRQALRFIRIAEAMRAMHYTARPTRLRSYAAIVAAACSLHGPRSPVGLTQRSQ